VSDRNRAAPVSAESLLTAQHTTGLNVVGVGGVGDERDKGATNISVAVSPEFLKTDLSLLSPVHNFFVRSPIVKKLLEITHR